MRVWLVLGFAAVAMRANGWAAEPPPSDPLAPTAAPAPPPLNRFLGLPYAGVHAFSGRSARDLGPGLRAGVLLGGRLSDRFSANGEIAVDFMNLDPLGGSNALERATYLSFSPLFHVDYSSTGQIVIGPRIGVWRLAGGSPGGTDLGYSGWMVGANAGVFFRSAGTVALGVLVSYANLQFTRGCQSAAAGWCPGDRDVLAATAAALF